MGYAIALTNVGRPLPEFVLEIYRYPLWVSSFYEFVQTLEAQIIFSDWSAQRLLDSNWFGNNVICIEAKDRIMEVISSGL